MAAHSSPSSDRSSANRDWVTLTNSSSTTSPGQLRLTAIHFSLPDSKVVLHVLPQCARPLGLGLAPKRALNPNDMGELVLHGPPWAFRAAIATRS